MEYVGEEIMVETEDGNDGGWVETHHFDATTMSEVEDKVCEMTLDSNKTDDMEAESKAMQQQQQQRTLAADEGDGNDDDDDDEAVDMEEFEESGMLEMVDPATATMSPEQRKCAEEKAASSAAADVDTEDGVVHTRTYDLHITYDKYYQTPRLWVVGYDENRKSLTVEQMYEDVSQDHAKKTVTMESHPHLPGPNMASVHPCK